MVERKIINDGKIVVPSPTEISKKQKKTVIAPQVISQQVADSAPEETVNNNPVLLFTVTQGMWKEPQKYIVQLAEHLKDTYNIHIVFGTFEFTGKNVLKEKIESLGGTVHTIDPLSHKNVLFNELSVLIEMWKLMRKISPDVVHFNDGKTSLLGGLAALLSGVRRTIATIHGYPDTSGMKTIEVSVLNFFIKLSYGRAQKIIVRDANTASWAKPMFGQSKVHLILPGIIHTQYTQPTEKLRAVAQDAPAEIAGLLRGAETIIIGNVAPLDADQGIAYTLQALKVLKEKGLSFVYMHYGDGDQSHLLQHEINEFGLNHNVLFKGTDKMANSYFPIFDMVVHPTLRSGVPPIVRDIAMTERPLIITDVTGVPESLENGVEAIIVPQGDVQALADAIELLARDKAKRDTMGSAIKARIEHDYDEQKMFAQTKEIYS